jgi:ABC-type phosphate/phosphonate transport system substrate-binding protein
MKLNVLNNDEEVTVFDATELHLYRNEEEITRLAADQVRMIWQSSVSPDSGNEFATSQGDLG